MSNEKLNAIVGNEREVVLGEKKVVIKKLPLGEYSKILLAMKKMPTSVMKEFQDLDTSNEEQFLPVLFGTFAEAWGQVLEIISIGSGLDKETIEKDPNIGLDGGIELFVAIYEVNNLNKVVKQVKNLFAQNVKK